MISGASPIEELGLKARSLSAVKRLSVTTIGELAARSDKDLEDAGIGAVTRADISDSLALVRLTLRHGDATDRQSAAPLLQIVPPAVRSTESLESAEPSVHVGLDEQTLMDDASPGPDFAENLDHVSTQLFGKPFRPKQAKKRTYVSDDDRANRFARRRTKRAPVRDDPEDMARVEQLKQTYTMDVDDAAWLLGISTDLVYAGCANDTIPNIHIGKRYKVVTDRLFALLIPPETNSC